MAVLPEIAPAFFCFTIILTSSTFATGLSTIPFVENGGTVVFARRENESNVSIFCRVSINGSAFDTAWFLTRLGETEFRITFGSVPIPNFVLSGVTSNLTIETFSRDLDRGILRCTNTAPGEIGENVMFQLRIIEPPVLRRESTATPAAENSVFSFNIEQSAGFPLVPSYQWYHDGVPINTNTSINPNVSDYPQIVFNPLLRTHSGNYSMIATTEAGNSTGYFIINVLAPPAGIQGSSEVFTVSGMDTTITAFTGVTGNPTPNSTWTRNGSPLASGMMYGTDSTGVLMISNVMLSDSGNYTNTLHNMFNNQSFTNNHTISLQVLQSASMPQSFSVINITSSAVVLRWLNPINSGVPAFDRFSIKLTTTSKIISMSVNAVNNTDPSYTNTLTVTGLEPNTNYTVSIRAVSSHSALGENELTSDSITQVITTNVSIAQFEQTNLENIDGMLEVRWALRHTGGLPLLSISVTCNGDNRLSNMSLCSVGTCGTRDSSSRLGPVEAGNNYTCTVTASNVLGSTTSDTNAVIAFSGIPSTPQISLVSITGLMVRLLITTAYTGVPAGDTSLHINISVYNTTRELLYQIPLNYSLINYLGTSASLSHELSLQPGSYQFSVTAGNRYGSSLESELTAGTAVGVGEASTLPIIVGVSVCSVVIVILAVSVLVTVIICCCINKRGKETKKTPNPNPVALQHFQSVENECYGVLRGGVPQSIELKDNAAYSSVLQTQSAPHSQSIAVNDNIAYRTTTEKTDPSYD